MIELAIFLRGVNVNGLSLKMKALKGVISSIGYLRVKTYLTSGNITCQWEDSSTPQCDEALWLSWHKSRIEAALRHHFNYDAHVFVMTLDAVTAIVSEARDYWVPDGYHQYVLVTNTDVREPLARIFESGSKAEHECLILGCHCMYWIYPKGETLSSDFGKRALGSAYKASLTSRTLGTLERMTRDSY